MPTYTVTVTDEIITNLQYLMDNQDTARSVSMYTLPPTIDELVQNIVNERLSQMSSIAQGLQDTELLNTVKNDPTLRASAVTLINDAKIKIKDAKTNPPKGSQATQDPMITDPPVTPDPIVTDPIV